MKWKTIVQLESRLVEKIFNKRLFSVMEIRNGGRSMMMRSSHCRFKMLMIFFLGASISMVIKIYMSMVVVSSFSPSSLLYSTKAPGTKHKVNLTLPWDITMSSMSASNVTKTQKLNKEQHSSSISRYPTIIHSVLCMRVPWTVTGSIHYLTFFTERVSQILPPLSPRTYAF